MFSNEFRVEKQFEYKYQGLMFFVFPVKGELKSIELKF